MNPKHFNTKRDWDIFAILLRLFENRFDDKAAEKLQDFSIRVQVLLDHLMEYPEDRMKVFENIPEHFCSHCATRNRAERECPGCGAMLTIQPSVTWVKTSDVGLHALRDAILGPPA